MCDDEVAALVVDNGSGMCKVRSYFIWQSIYTLKRRVLPEMMHPEQYNTAEY